jgi:hypothetical protein
VGADAALLLHKIQNTIPNGHRIETRRIVRKEGYRINQRAMKTGSVSGKELPRER